VSPIPILKLHYEVVTYSSILPIFTFCGLFRHYVHKETIIQEMEEASYLLEKKFQFFTRTTFYNLCGENER